MRRKSIPREHFAIDRGDEEGTKRPLERIFCQSEFQGFAFGTYGEISSSNVYGNW